MNRLIVFVMVMTCAPLPTALADLAEVKGKLVVIDAKERTITIQGKTLEVPKKCVLVVDGELADLASLKEGNIAVVKYDDALEIATSITVGDSPDQKESADLMLLNGKNLSGWRYLGDEKQLEKAWGIKAGGILQCSGADDVAPLVSDQKYKNFMLTLEWRFPPGVTPSKDGMGVAVRMDQSSAKQVRYQLQDGMNSHLWVIGQSEPPEPLLGTVLTVNNNPLVRGPKVARKPLGTWNILAITCDGEEVTIEQNGEETIHVRGVDSVAGYIGFVPAKTKAEIRKMVLTPK